MTTFRFSAVSNDGSLIIGTIDKEDCGGVIAHLNARGMLPIRVAAVSARWIYTVTGTRRLHGECLTSRAVARLLERVAALVSGGVSIERALSIAAGNQLDGTKRAAGELLQRVRAGCSLAEAMAAEPRSFTPFVVSMVRAAEASGKIADTLETLTNYLVRREEARQNLRSALIYPSVVLSTGALSLLFVFMAVLPALQPLLEDGGANLPLTGRVAFAASAALQQYWCPLAAGLGVVTLVSIGLWRHPVVKGRRDAMVLRVPLLGGAICKAQTGRFARALGALIGGGIALSAALTIARPVLSNRAMYDSLGKVIDAFKGGGGLAEPLSRAGVFPELAVQLIEIGESAGRLHPMLDQAADFMESEVRHAIKRSMVLLTPFITVILGLMISVVATSVMTALLSINDLPH